MLGETFDTRPRRIAFGKVQHVSIDEHWQGRVVGDVLVRCEIVNRDVPVKWVLSVESSFFSIAP